MIHPCCDERRRQQAVRDHGRLNGIDFLEVLDDPALPDEERQRTLFVHFLKPLAPGAVGRENLRIEGGERIRSIAIAGDPAIGAGPEAHVLTVRVEEPGDFSIYTLRLVRSRNDRRPPEGFDPLLAAVDFSFKIECPSDFDCRPACVCPPEPRAEPEIDYLAKDYASFRRLMLDRLAVLVPEWRERNAADLGIALVELLAYAGDHLSYWQDAVATEAYLGTARRRVSLRRHARLVDYAMHDGCNARVWVQVQVAGAPAVELRRRAGSTGHERPIQLLTRVPGVAVHVEADTPEYAEVLARGAEVFEFLHDARLHPEHNRMAFHAWGAEECCVPVGGTRATLRGHYPNLRSGQVLILEEVRGPRTGEPADADPGHRHPVRLTAVSLAEDPLGGRFADPPTDHPAPITEIEWAAADALPFPLCIATRADAAHGGEPVGDVSVALGNIVLADHGRTVAQTLDPVPVPDQDRLRVPAQRLARCADGAARAAERERLQIWPRFRPHLTGGPVTQAAPFIATAPATDAFRWSMAEVLPAVELDNAWTPQRDLLASDRFDRHFVVEVEADGGAALRFGDGRHGARPVPGTELAATYRIGNGARGNVGAETIAHIVGGDPAIVALRNPLPARGGTEPESSEAVRRNAPAAFRRQERAVTAEDYAEVAGRDAEVQRAAATFRWTGSWRTAFVTVDRLGGLPVDAPFERKMRRHLERYRLAGHDLEIDAPRFVPLEIAMHVCVERDHFRSDVQRALLEVFSSRRRPDGTRGVFHPDNFSFGQAVYLSPLYAAAQATAGVASATITVFRRRDHQGEEALDQGWLSIGRLEIAQLDNDPNFPERGVFHLTLDGGK